MIQEGEVRQKVPWSLNTGVRLLDKILDPLEASSITLMDSGSDFVFHLTSLLCVRSVMEGRNVVFIDGGNSVDPHGMVAIAKRVGLRRLDVLPHVHIARAFTCHQMATLVLETMEGKVREVEAGLLVLSCLPDLFLDEEVPYSEARQLFMRCLERIREVTEDSDVITIITNAGLAKLHRRRGIRRQLYEAADKKVRMTCRRGALLISIVDEGVNHLYNPVPPDQATLEDSIAPHPRLTGLQPPERFKEISRSMEHLRIAW